ncbi:MAG: ABC transporter ATP-binding protein [bacterium]
MKNIIQIYKIMLRYWPHLIAGFISLLGFAAFSGFSITMIIPLFDYVFIPREATTTIYNVSDFFHSLGEKLNQVFAQIDSILDLQQKEIHILLTDGLSDVLSHTDPWLLLMVICVAFFTLVLIKNIFYFLNKICFATLRGKTILDIRNSIFENYLHQSLKFYDINKPGDSLVRLVNDVNIVSKMFLNQMFNLVRDVILLLVFAVMAIIINVKFFLFSLIILPVFSLLVSWLGKKLKKYAKRIQSKFSHMFSNIEEVLNSMKIVQAFSRENFELEKFKTINWKYFLFWRKSIFYTSFNGPIGELHGTLTAILVILIGGRLVLDPESSISTGEFMLFLAAIFSMLHPIKTLTKAYADIRKAQVSLDRIYYVLNLETGIKNPVDPVTKKTFTTDIRFKDVNFGYNSDIDVLRNINLEIKKGEKIAFVGSSGAGKTTLVNLLPRMYDTNSGEILIDGINIKQIDLKDLRTLFGTVTQESILFSETIADNIRYGSLNKVKDEDVKKAAQIAYADEFIKNLPNQYEEMLHHKGSNLSGGQQQRLCIARAIVDDPPILIFDEATSALDTEAEKKVQRAINQATKNRTVLVIAHRLSTVLSVDKIVVMDKGEIVDIGNHNELLQRCTRYQTLYNLQFDDSGAMGVR